jgi:uncharacterized protein YjbI with pentapeptide repeats
MQTFLIALPSLVAVGALIFTWVSIVKTTDATNHQLQITEQGQVTDRYNVAITNLGSTSEDIRLGGIYALRRVMEDSPRDQSAIVAVLCAFVRNHTIVPTVAPSLSLGTSRSQTQPRADIWAALFVVGMRNSAHDDSRTFLDLNHARIDGVTLFGNFAEASFIGAQLRGAQLLADLFNADFEHADLTDADLGRARIDGAHFSYASLDHAFLEGRSGEGVSFAGAHLSYAYLEGSNLKHANFRGARLSHADLSPDSYDGPVELNDADLTGADLTDANLRGADLRYAEFANADLRNANLIDAQVDGTNFSGANLTGARGLRTSIPPSPTSSTPASTKNLRQ